jgi:tRNA (guanine-N7-)-methyltransferase
LLKTKGVIEFKTDNPILYSYTIESFKAFKKFKIVYQTENLYQDVIELKNNVQTEYENKFVKQNIKIKKIKVIKY